jgi:formylglycine-generating enzyme required for sulfatase activity
MCGEGARTSRSRWYRAGAAGALAALLTFPAFHTAAAQDDRYPAVASPVAPAASRLSTARDARWHPARRPVRRHVAPPAAPAAAPKVDAPVKTATLPPAATPLTPADPALNGIALDAGWPKQVFVISDSVMLGAKPALARGMPDWQVNFLGRPALMIGKAIGELPGYVGSVAVVALGYNSLWEKERHNFKRWSDAFDKSAENMVAALKARGARKIVWVLLRELSSDNIPSNGTAALQATKYGWYFPYVNERLHALKERHPEIALADWVTAGRRGGITYDSIHLNTRGAELMVDVVRAAIGLPPRPPKVVAEGRPPEETPPREVDKQTVIAAPVVPERSETQDVSEKQEVSQKQETAEKQEPAHSGGEQIVASLDLRKSAAESAAPVAPMAKPSYAFRDCAKCPEMVVIPAGSFTMGSPESEPDRSAEEGPQRVVTIARPFAVGKFEVTFAEWAACVAGGGCKGNANPGDEGWGKDRRPVINVSWDDAREYVAWLSKTTGKPYRLLTEAEWEYAARAGTSTPFATGAAITPEQANFQTPFKENGEEREGEYREKTIAVGTFAPNAFDLHDMHGNVWEWVRDNWHEDFAGAPTDGSVMPGGDATMRTKRGGGWYSLVTEIRSASRQGDQPDHRGSDIGFRVARGL